VSNSTAAGTVATGGRSLAIPATTPVVIWNVNAGSKAGLPTNGIDERGLRELMARHGLGGELVPTRSEDEARAAVRRALEGGRRPIVAAGGDGTTELIASELLDTGVALGILPLGSAMNLSRSLGIPRDHDQAADVIAIGREWQIDVGEVGDRRFYECVSIGLSAELFAAAHAVDKGRYWSLLALIGLVRRARRRVFRMRLDGEVIEGRAIMIAIANTPYTGLGFTVAPDARLDDGQLDVRIYRRLTPLEIARHFWSIAFGRRAYEPRVEQHRASRVAMETAGLRCRADDFDLGRTPVSAGVRPRALTVIVPADREAG
jgi:diacylglycerol kinase (ATP)